MKKKIVSYLLLCLLAVAMLGMNASADVTETTDESYSKETAVQMSSPNEIVHGTLQDYDKDYYKFDVETGGVMNLKMTTTAEYVPLLFFHAEKGTIFTLASYADPTKESIDETIYLRKGTYYLQVGDASYSRQYTGETYTITPTYESLQLSHFDSNNDSMANALPISPGITYNEVQMATFQKDYYKMEITQPGTIHLNLKGFSYENNEFFSCYFYSDTRRLDFTVSADFTYYDDNTSSFVWPYFVEPGTYYFEIGGEGNGEDIWGGPYSFSYTFEPVVGAKAEPNDDFASASAIELNTTVNGIIALNDAHDYYKVTIPSSGLLEIAFDENMIKAYPGSSGGGGRFAIYDANQKQVALTYVDTTYKMYVDAGEYYFSSNQDGEYIGPYSFTSKFTAVAESFPEEDDTEEQANLVELGKEYCGMIAKKDDSDFIKYVVDKEQDLSVVFNYYTLGDGFYLFDTNKNSSFYADSEKEESGTLIMDLGTVTPGTYTINIYANHGYSGYMGGFTYNFKIVPTDSVAKSTSIALNKKKQSIIQGKTYQLVATVSPDNTTNKSIEWTTSNKKIATVDENGKVTAKGIGQAKITATTKDTGKTVTCTITVKPKTPKLTVKKKGKNVQLSWKKISGATGYKIYRSTKKKSGYKLVKTIKKNKTVKFTQKMSSLKNKKTYYYKIVAYKKVGKKTYTSSYSNVKSFKK